MLAALLAAASWELSVSGRDGLKGTIDDARTCIFTIALVTFYGQAVGIILGVIFYYMSSYSELYFGKENEKEAANIRFHKNSQEMWAIIDKTKRDMKKQWSSPYYGVFYSCVSSDDDYDVDNDDEGSYCVYINDDDAGDYENNPISSASGNEKQI